MHLHWYMMTAVMPMCFTVCITLIILQTKALTWSKEIDNNSWFTDKKRELFCLYGQYIIGGMCAIQCFLCHISNIFPEYYCIYGMSFCVVIYAATKACLYGYFLERAKSVQGVTTLLYPFIWTYIFPLYIALYFIVYLILCPLNFRGKVVDPMTDNSVPTACVFGQFHSWVFNLSAGVDLINCILFLFLFIWPIYVLTHEKFDGTDTQRLKMTPELREVVKYNVIGNTICSISSITFLFVMAFSQYGSIGYYLWLGGNIDIMINSISLFLMLGTNRRYLRYICCHTVVKPPSMHASFIDEACVTRSNSSKMSSNSTLQTPKIKAANIQANMANIIQMNSQINTQQDQIQQKQSDLKVKVSHELN